MKLIFTQDVKVRKKLILTRLGKRRPQERMRRFLSRRRKAQIRLGLGKVYQLEAHDPAIPHSQKGTSEARDFNKDDLALQLQILEKHRHNKKQIENQVKEIAILTNESETYKNESKSVETKVVALRGELDHYKKRYDDIMEELKMEDIIVDFVKKNRDLALQAKTNMTSGITFAKRLQRQTGQTKEKMDETIQDLMRGFVRLTGNWYTLLGGYKYTMTSSYVRNCKTIPNSKLPHKGLDTIGKQRVMAALYKKLKRSDTHHKFWTAGRKNPANTHQLIWPDGSVVWESIYKLDVKCSVFDTETLDIERMKCGNQKDIDYLCEAPM